MLISDKNVSDKLLNEYVVYTMKLNKLLLDSVEINEWHTRAVMYLSRMIMLLHEEICLSVNEPYDVKDSEFNTEFHRVTQKMSLPKGE